jgi:O-antigen/teichoic acid export membrane protein
LQAYERFFALSFIQIFINALRLLAVAMLLIVNIANINTSMTAYILMPLIGFSIGFFIIPFDFLKTKNENSVIRNFFGFNKWVAGISILSAVASRADVYLTAKYLSAFQLGLYAASNQLVQVVPQIIGSVGTVIAPKMASMKNLQEFKIYLKKTIGLVSGISLLGVLSIPIVVFLIPLIYGKSYQGSSEVFIILMISMLIFLLSTPFHMSIYYYFSYPKLFFVLSLIYLFVVVILGRLFIPVWGINGSALVVLIAQSINFIIPVIWMYKKVNNEQK